MRVLFFGVAIAVGVHKMNETPGLLVFLFLLAACSNGTNTSPRRDDGISSSSKTVEQAYIPKENILNNIVLESVKGFKITSAFLADEKGNLVPLDNTIPGGHPVYLTLRIQEGWTLQKGYTSPGATQTILSHNNEPVLQSGDLFANIPRVKKEDAGTLRLKTLITATRSDIRYYNVRFRVWDKWGEGEITGHYRLHVEP